MFRPVRFSVASRPPGLPDFPLPHGQSIRHDDEGTGALNRKQYAEVFQFADVCPR